MKILNRHSRASALLLSFFLMSILVLVGMAVSVLVIHDLRASRIMVSGAQALYAAEGMTELGLESEKENLPGYEPELTGAFSNSSSATLAVHARESMVPCEGQGDEWRALSQNESIQIPLFAQIDPDGAKVDLDNFYVDFYVAELDGTIVSPLLDQDVLRWKILGLKTGTTETQALSEYIPLNGSQTTEGNPSVFGVVDDSVPDDYRYGKFYDASGAYSIFHARYSLEAFLAGHSYNYLVLTNVVTRDTENTIYFRFHSDDVAGVCEYAQLATVGNGPIGDTQQELSTLVKEGENLPVFDFVLYHTGEDSGLSSALSAGSALSISSAWLPWSH